MGVVFALIKKEQTMEEQLYRIVDDNGLTIDNDEDLENLTLTQAEHKLCKLLNLDIECWIQEQ